MTAAPATTGTVARPARRGLPPVVLALAFVVPFVASVAGSSIIGDATFPSPFAADADIRRYFAGNHDAVVLQSLLQCVSSVALLLLAVRLAEAAGGAAARLITAAGGVAAAFHVLSAMVGWVAVRDAVQADGPLVRALHDLAFLTGGPAGVAALGVMIGATAAGLGAALPGWARAAGLVLLALALLSLLCLAAQPAAFLLPIARFGGMLWLIFATVRMTR
ncbi:hypothetical protein [Actinomadura macrotermitis]|uniref:DUF4386 domain-containing protein n=1 Tax=Actinomadura macrotermitis TaxID=2585200 RepID=A0A7K0BWS4_9ACTN|nr:hypothetical protein [Actinomadura macrotermitis]MQY05633.1 hypothetical protein [Actinomadura macrotermitis]